MAIKTKPFDAARYFDTAEAQARLLNDAFESGDPGYVAAALGTIARARGVGEIASEAGLNRQALYAALREGGNPTLATVMKVLNAVNMRLGASVVETAPV